MNDELSSQIEEYLRTNRRWIPAREICEHFHVRERALRALGEKPGLVSEFAISGDKGFKHLTTASEDEFSRFYARSRSHAIGEMVRIRKLRHRRAALLAETKTKPPLIVERATGQVVFQMN